jgi:hypothetical protein
MPAIGMPLGRRFAQPCRGCRARRTVCDGDFDERAGALSVR